MRCSCQLSRPSRRESSVIRLTAAVAVTILLLVGGATVMIWNARDLMETLSWQGGPSEAGVTQERPEDPRPGVVAAALSPESDEASLVIFRPRPTTSASRTTTAPSSTTQTTAISASVTSSTLTPVTSTSTNPPNSSCSDGATAVLFGGLSYCPGYIIGVKQTSYGVGARIVFNGLATSVDGSTATIEGGPSCLPAPSTGPVYCAATVPSIAVSFAGLSTSPRAGDLLRVYGISGVSSMTPTGHFVTGFCAPDFC